MLKLDEVLAESRSMSGPLGAVAFVVLKALDTAGAPAEELERTKKALFEYLAALSDEDCNVLAEVAHRRLADRPADGKWY